MAAPMTYLRLTAQKYAKIVNTAGIYHNLGLNLRYRCDKAVEEFTYEDDSYDQEEEINKMRDVSNLRPWLYNKYKGQGYMNNSETQEKHRYYYRKQYARYGSASGVNPSICWPSKPELDELIKDDQKWELSFEQLVQTAREKREAEQKEIDDRQKIIAERMAKMDDMIRDYKKRQAKIPEEQQKSKERREKVLEEAAEYYGYRIEPKGEKYKEFMTMRSEADKLKKKAEKKAMRQQGQGKQ